MIPFGHVLASLVAPVQVALTTTVPEARGPFLAGVPLPRGAVQTVERLVRVDRGAGTRRRVPARFTPLLRWPDGSLRWVAVEGYRHLRGRRATVRSGSRHASPSAAPDVEWIDETRARIGLGRWAVDIRRVGDACPCAAFGPGLPAAVAPDAGGGFAFAWDDGAPVTCRLRRVDPIAGAARVIVCDVDRRFAASWLFDVDGHWTLDVRVDRWPPTGERLVLRMPCPGAPPVLETGLLRFNGGIVAVLDPDHLGPRAIRIEGGTLVVDVVVRARTAAGAGARLRFSWGMAADPIGLRRWLDDPGGGWRPSARALRSAGWATPKRAPGALARDLLELLLADFDAPSARNGHDLGDFHVPHLGWSNGEFDALLALVRGALWDRDPRAWRWARRAARHLRDVDWDRDASDLPFMHGFEHRGTVELGHVWLEGLVRFGCLAGDARCLDVAERIAAAIAERAMRRDGRFRLEREYGWVLHALTVAADAWPGDARFDAAAHAVAASLLERTRASGHLAIESLRSGRGYRTTTFVAVGIVAPALARHAMRTGDRRAAAVARRIVRAARLDGWDPERARLSWSIVTDDSGRRLAARGSVAGGDMLFVAAGARVAGGADEQPWTRTLERVGARRFRRSGLGAHGTARVRAIHALWTLAGGE